jgi:hypothetical protein
MIGLKLGGLKGCTFHEILNIPNLYFMNKKNFKVVRNAKGIIFMGFRIKAIYLKME